MERQGNVLIVDDDPFALQSIAKVLEGESYEVTTAASGSEALDLLKQESFDLVLTDLRMPDVDGLEVLRQAKEIAPQAVVLILTGYASVESAIEALREGAYDYLVKPSSDDELKLKIERGLETVRLAEERQRTEEALERRAIQLATLNRVGRQVASILDQQELLQQAVDAVREDLGYFQSAVLLLDEEASELYVAAATDDFWEIIPDGYRQPVGKGAIGTAAQTKQTVLVSDASSNSRVYRVGEWFSPSSLSVPIKIGGRVIGVLEVEDDVPNAFDVNDQATLEIMVDQVASAIENARLYEETRQRALEQETVSYIAYALNTPDIRDAYPVLVKELQNLTGCDTVGLIAMDEAGEQSIVTVLESPFPIPGEGEVMPLSATAAAEDLKASRPHLTAYLSTETHFPFEQALYQAGLRSWATLPLLIGGEFFGGLNLGGRDSGLFRKDQLPVLQQIADAVALALQNSFIFLAEQERRESAEALEEAAAIVNSTLDLDQVLDRILEQVSRVVPNDATNIMLIEGDQARVVRWRGYERFGAEEFVSKVVFHIPEVSNLQQMVDNKEPLAIPDTAAHPDWVDVPVQAWLRSYAAAPIVVRGEVIGFLNMDSAISDFFTQADAEALRAFANHAAAAIENARLYEAEQERRHIAETLGQATTVLSSTLEIDEVLELILQKLRQVIPYDSASVQRLQEGCLRIVACQGFEEPDKVLGLVFPLDPKFPNHRVVITKAPLAIEDIAQDYPHFKNEADTYKSGRIRSWLGVPLMVRDEVIGMIAVDRAEVRSYTAEESELARAFANQAAIAVENARLFDETMERAESLSALYEIGKQINATLELDRVLEVICDEAMRATGAAIAEVSLVDLERGIWEMKAIRGYSENWKGRIFSLDEGITGRVARTGELAVIPDVRQADDHLGDARIRSELTVPILSEGKVIGVVNIESTELSAFGEDDLHFLQALADQTAIALKNASFFEEERRRATQLALINEVGEKAASILDLDKLMQEVTRSIQESFNYYNVAFFLLDEERREGAMQAVAGGFEHVAADEYRQSLDEGIIGFTARTGEYWLANDISKDPHYVKGFLDEVLTRSELCVPIKLGDKVIGVLDVQSIRLNDFGQADVVALQTVADRVAIAIQNAQLFEKTEHLKAFNESIVQGVAEAILIEDAQGILTFANPAAEELLECTREELVGRHWTSIVPEEQTKKIQKELVKRPQRVQSRYETALLSKEGQMIPVIVSARPLFEDGEFVGVLSAFTDIRERVRREREIEERRRYLEGVLRAAPDAIVTLDAHHRIEEWNPGAERLFKYSREEAIGQDLDSLVTSPDVFEEAVGLTQVVLKGKEVPPTEAVRYRKDGSPVDVLVGASPIMVGDELIGIVAAYTDITERVRAEEELVYIATHDSLTGVPNRLGFFTLAGQQLKMANRTKTRMLLLFADLDNLKRINDTFGHQEGDRALIEAADVLKETFRESDIMARIGGDEFVVLAVETNGDGAEILATRLRENLEARNAKGDRRYELSLSVGIARYDPEHPCSIDELVTRADRAMYKRKRGTDLA
jgi:diguanylate cyclase (GGDEF)-like protein/PAS domain S-box-containing protein